MIPLVGPLILGSIVDLEERAMALEARAFGRKGPKTSLLVLADSGWQRAARWGFGAAALLIVAWRVLL